MKGALVILTVLAVAATACAATVPQTARQQLPPCQPAVPTAPPAVPWTPQATIEVDEGAATATFGSQTCVLTEALPEGQFLPPTAEVQRYWGRELVVVRAYPSPVTYSCQLEAGGGDRR